MQMAARGKGRPRIRSARVPMERKASVGLKRLSSTWGMQRNASIPRTMITTPTAVASFRVPVMRLGFRAP